jgi:hypothetical protein
MPEVIYWADPAARRALLDTGRQMLEQIRNDISEQSGVIAIDLASGEYYVAPTLGKANDAAYAHHPDQWLYFARLDREGAEVVLPTW